MSSKLHIGNLPPWVTDKDLSEKFSRFGIVAFAAVIKDAISGESRGFGYVEMADLASADSAIKWLNFSSYGGQIMAVSRFSGAQTIH